MRFVIDTNLLVSGIISAGLPRQLLDAARTGDFELCTSEVLLTELQHVLGRDKFANRLAGQTPESIVSALRELAIVVVPTEIPRVVLTDPDDDHVLAAALTGAAHLTAFGRSTRPAAACQLSGYSHRHCTPSLERLASRALSGEGQAHLHRGVGGDQPVGEALVRGGHLGHRDVGESHCHANLERRYEVRLPD